MMSFIDKLTAHDPTERPCHSLRLNYLPIYRHCPQPYQTNADLQRKEEPERRFDFLRLKTERLLCAVSHHARPTFF